MQAAHLRRDLRPDRSDGMSVWESEQSDGLLELETGWVRMSRIESIVIDSKRWGVTGGGKDLYLATVTLISGATFTHKTSDPKGFVRLAAGIMP